MKTRKTEIISGGGGNLPYGFRALLNMSSTPYEVEHGYDTVANGYAYPIVAKPHGYVARISGGSPRDFASWLVSDSFADIVEQMAEHPKAFDGVMVLLPGKDRPVSIGAEQCHILFGIADSDSEASAVEKAAAWHKKYF